jgi:hypothetical protein
LTGEARGRTGARRDRTPILNHLITWMEMQPAAVHPFRREKRKYQLMRPISMIPAAVTRIFMVIPLPPYGRIFMRRSRSEFDTTETELKAMAAEAMIGSSSTLKKG